MKRKGFTLIELLAVIVILAIIALVAIPVVLNMINSAKKSAAKSSALGYVEAIEYNNGFAQISSETGTSGYTPVVTGDVADANAALGSHLKGKKPSSGTVTIGTNGKVEGATLCFNEFRVTYDGRDVTEVVSSSECGGSSSEVIDNNDEPEVPERVFEEPEGVYVREICEGTNTYNKKTLYKVKKVEDMACLSKIVGEGTNFSGAEIQLVADIDFSKQADYVNSSTETYGDINGDETTESLYTELTTGKGFKPIGNNSSSSYQFKGTFIGNMFTLSNITINRPDDNQVGIFGYANGDIKKLKVKNINITGKHSTGGIAGVLKSKKVETIEASNIEVNGAGNVGGIVGYLDSGTLNEIKFNASVTGTDSNVGGIAGQNNKGSILNIVGSVEVEGTSSTGAITAHTYDGSINGVILESGSSSGYTSYSSNYNGWTDVQNVYYLEGFTATNAGGTMYDKDASKNTNAYESAIDTIIGGDSDNTGYYFRFDKNNEIQLVSVEDYPINFTLSGTGTEQDPYLIGSVKEWNEATTKAQLTNTYFKLTANLDFTGKEFLKMGGPNTPFRGTFDGNNKTISGITISGGSYQGVFGYLESTAVVKDLTISNSKIEKASTYVGMLAGYMKSGATITNVKIPNVEVEGMGYTGGLVGYNAGTISDLTLSNITVKNTGSYTGGITGYASGNVQRMKVNNINVTGKYRTGGIAGYLGSNKKIETIEALNIEVNGTGSVGGIVGYLDSGTVNEIKLDTEVTGTDSNVGGIVGYNNKGSILNIVGSVEVEGTSSTGAVTANTYYGSINGVILESGSSSGYTSYSSNYNGWTDVQNVYYLEGFTAEHAGGTKWDSSYLHDLTKYSEAVETSINGDTNGTGYYFDYNNGHTDIILKEAE